MFTALLGQLVTGSPLVFEVVGTEGPGRGKHVVLLAGDEEYRSEEMLPQLAKILATRHGFRCTVVFSLNGDGEIDPNERRRQPGIEALKDADVCIMMLRFRTWDEPTMKVFADYLESGRPIFALRTSTHAFDFPADSTNAYRRFGWQSRDWPGGFGKQVLGENWVSHWGKHGSQGTRGIPVADHPINRGVAEVFVPTDVYEASPPADATVLMRGEVVEGMRAGDPAATSRKKTAAGAEQGINDPMMPVLWTRDFTASSAKTSRILTCTMGSATDFSNAGFRRLVVNGVFWLSGLNIPAEVDVNVVGDYKPTNFGFEGFQKGVRPSDHATGE